MDADSSLEFLTPKPHTPEASDDSYLKNQDVSNLYAPKALSGYKKIRHRYIRTIYGEWRLLHLTQKSMNTAVKETNRK